MFHQTKFLGMTLLADNEQLFKLLHHPGQYSAAKINGQIAETWPGLLDAIATGRREIEIKRNLATLVLFVNHRVQVWAGRQFDCKPSEPIFVQQIGMEYDPSGDSQRS